ncbi:hypothetical protein SH203_01961 [Brevundimonas sp. SH203]|uniref:DUF6491 family protein n=1 Tax=Brevundimonas sp. SH203 TaxID=345167 RepID=UPI0009C95D67|nr:DUF6491 family protein [Brevundimonas sp. SH203]GAW41553.1 hypothetical protein SH203_01961 [Brevundimonas sp. SH203]
MLRLALPSAALLAPVLALAACAPAAPGLSPSAARTAANPCFRPSLVRNFTAPNEQTLYVRTSATEVFQIDATVCRDLPQALSIALVPMDGSSRLCVGDPARLRSPTTGPEPCRVRVLRQLTADEIAALPSRDRP